MPLPYTKLRGYVQRNWFLTLVVSFALVLELLQIWIQRVFHLSILFTGVLAVIAIAAVLAWILLILRLRQPFTDARYRWLTRDVNRAMRKTSRRLRRPVE
jgi:hypothetical protein